VTKLANLVTKVVESPGYKLHTTPADNLLHNAEEITGEYVEGLAENIRGKLELLTSLGNIQTLATYLGEEATDHMKKERSEHQASVREKDQLISDLKEENTALINKVKNISEQNTKHRSNTKAKSDDAMLDAILKQNPPISTPIVEDSTKNMLMNKLYACQCQLLRVGTRAHDALMNWVQEIEINVWAMRMIRSLSTKLNIEKQRVYELMKRISILVHVSEGPDGDFANKQLVMFFKDLLKDDTDPSSWVKMTTNMRAIVEDRDLDELVFSVWNRKKSDVINDTVKMQFTFKKIHSLSSFAANFIDDTTCPELRELGKIMDRAGTYTTGVFSEHHHDVMAKAMMNPIHETIKQMEQIVKCKGMDTPNLALVMDTCLVIHNHVDAMMFNVTNTSEKQVLEVVLKNMLDNIIFTVLSDESLYAYHGLLMTYASKASGCSWALYSNYQLGVRLRGQEGKVDVTVWSPMTFGTFYVPLAVQFYTRQYKSSGVSLMVKAQRAVVQSRSVVVQDNQRSVVLKIPSTWFDKVSTAMYSSLLMNEEPRFQEQMNGVLHDVKVFGGITKPRASVDLVHKKALSTFAFMCNPVKPMSNGAFADKELRMSEAQMNTAVRKFANDDFVSNRDFLTTQEYMAR